MRVEARRFDDAYLRKSFYDPGRIDETFDGDEAYAPGTISYADARGLATRRGGRADVSLHSDGWTHVSYRDVGRHELPVYVVRDLPDHVARYAHGRKR